MTQFLNAELMFEDDFSGGMGNWETSGSWGASGEMVSDTPSAYYSSNSDTSLTLAFTMDFGAMTHPVLAFSHTYDLEENYDFATVELSVDGGVSWSYVLATYTGYQAFSPEQLDLQAFAGQSQVKIRFRIVTDISVVKDGWLLDDIRVGEAPTPVVMEDPSDIGKNYVSLNWSACIDPKFYAYSILRSRTAGFDWRDAHAVAFISDAATTTFTDITVAPKTEYHYYVMLLTTEGLGSVSNEVSAMTPFGMDFPFVDDAEGGKNTWIADAPWSISDEAARSGSHCWSDSPGANYGDGISAQSLTIVAPIDLSGAVNPVWSFWYRSELIAGDFAYAEVSTDNGSSWTTVATLSSSENTEDWQYARISLASYLNPEVLLRFRMTTNVSANADGVQLDDISVSESPDALSLPVVSDLGAHEVTLSWAASSNPQVVKYVIYRELGTTADYSDELVGEVNAGDPLTFTDTLLQLNTDYAYRVYAINAYGTHSDETPTPTLVHTPSETLPFADDFEGDSIAWKFVTNNTSASTWAISENDARSGSHCLVDSPTSNYAPNTDSWAELAVDLSDTDWPVLTFWDKVDLSVGDWARLEVSCDGVSPQYAYGVYDSGHSEWRKHRVDLSDWRGHENVRIRFHLCSNYDSFVANGWLIEDVSVQENPDGETPLNLPVVEGFEGDIHDQWISAGWHVAEDDTTVDGSQSAVSIDGTVMRDDVLHILRLDQPLELDAGATPQITLWMRGVLTGYSYFRIGVSSNNGMTWSDLSDSVINSAWNHEEDWTRIQADLSAYAGQTVRLNLRVWNTNNPLAWLHLDKITISDMPEAVNLISADPSLRSVDLSWTESTLGSDFVRYEVWRSTVNNFGFSNGEKVFETTDVTETTVVDTGLNIGNTYYYRVFVVNQRDIFAPSNQMSVTTVPVGIPFSDNLDTMDNFVTGSNNSHLWGVETLDVYEGSGCLSVAPNGQYQSSTDSYAETAVDLSGVEWPILTFWDKVEVAEGDWVRLEIYADGKSSHFLYGENAGGHDEWRQQKVDLSFYSGHPNVRLRFHFYSNSDGFISKGWLIDRFSVEENPDGFTPLALPFEEDFEGDIQDNWTATGWHTVEDAFAVDGTHSGRSQDGILMRDDVEHNLWLNKPLEIPENSNLQVTFWMRGHLSNYSNFRLLYSSNRWINSHELSQVNLTNGWDSDEEYTRFQADLSSLSGQTVRLRFRATCTSNVVAWLNIDKITIAELPGSVDLVSASPSLRSVDLNWTESTLGESYVRYEVWRSLVNNVSVSNGEKVFETNDISNTSYTDSGLSIGETYYYRVFAVDTRDTFAPSNQLSATTVPVSLPFADNLDTMDNFVAGSNNGANWGTETIDVYEGTGCLAVAPNDQYQVSTDSTVETALDLSGVQWPVLSFRDKVDLGVGDWIRLEVYADGKTSINYYGENAGGHEDWRQQRIDLSYFRDLPNVGLRFHFYSNNDGYVGKGWLVDDLLVEENADKDAPLVLPFIEDFEGDIQDHWIASGWHPVIDTSSIDGTQSARSQDGTIMRDVVEHNLWLDQPLEVPADSNLQVTFWMRGHLNRTSHFRLLYSTNAWVNSYELADVSVNYTWDSDTEWTRFQANLSALAGQAIRLRWRVSCSSNPLAWLNIDKITIDEMPTAVTMLPVDDIQVDSVRLNWNSSTVPTFAKYRIYRSLTNVVTPSSELVAEIDDVTVDSYTDQGLKARVKYYYKVFVVDERDTLSPSETVSATTLGLNLPFSEDFESGEIRGWVLSGNWQLQNSVGRGGGTALVDSDGDYQASTQTEARFAVNLSGMEWPVLRFWDKFAFAGGSHGRVEISVDGTNWGNFLYGVTSNREQWREQFLDLSQWKNREQVFIRFRSYTDGNLADGWSIDDLSISENSTAPVYPFWEDFESGLDHWLPSRWTLVEDNAKSVTHCIQDSPEGRYAEDNYYSLVLAHELDLTGATDPVFSFWVRGELLSKSYFRVKVSINDGLTWADISALNLTYTWLSAEDWVFQQVSLASWVGQKIRLKFETSTTNQPYSNVFLDNIGIGEGPPEAPQLLSPSDEDSVDILRPTLVLENAIDYQSDAITYRFEVYSESELTNLVAAVPAVATSGIDTTEWVVDVNLPNNATYYWRARANDGTHDGPWSDVFSFSVNEINNPPEEVTLIGPPSGSIIYDDEQWLVWRTVGDPDAGDSVGVYKLQIDDDPSFSSVDIQLDNIQVQAEDATPGNLVGRAIGEILGQQTLSAGRWYWRVCAIDSKDLLGPWSSEPLSFKIASDFEHWVAATYSHPDQDNPMITGVDADPDGDNVLLLFEYACALDPTIASQEGAPQVQFVEIDGQMYVLFEFQRRIGVEEIFILQQSLDLESWQDVSGASLEVIQTIDATRELCEFKAPVSGTEGVFYRVKVIMP